MLGMYITFAEWPTSECCPRLQCKHPSSLWWPREETPSTIWWTDCHLREACWQAGFDNQLELWASLDLWNVKYVKTVITYKFVSAGTEFLETWLHWTVEHNPFSSMCVSTSTDIRTTHNSDIGVTQFIVRNQIDVFWKWNVPVHKWHIFDGLF